MLCLAFELVSSFSIGSVTDVLCIYLAVLIPKLSQSAKATVDDLGGTCQ